MLRTFREHDIRYVDSLDGRWEFVTEADRKSKGHLPGKYTRTIQVPSAWEMLPGLENYRGRAWLHKKVAAEDDRIGVKSLLGSCSENNISAGTNS